MELTYEEALEETLREAEFHSRREAWRYRNIPNYAADAEGFDLRQFIRLAMERYGFKNLLFTFDEEGYLIIYPTVESCTLKMKWNVEEQIWEAIVEHGIDS